MKVIVVIILTSILIYGCGTRSVGKEKYYQKTERKSNVTLKREDYNKRFESTKFQSELKKVTFLKNESSENKSTSNDIESKSEKTKEENNSKKIKRTDYYPNGQVKSEIELSEQYSKLENEKNYLKSRSEELETKLNLSIKTQDSIYKQNLDFASRNESLVKINKENLQKLDQTTDKLIKASEQKGVSFGSIVWIVIASLIAGVIIGQLIRLYFTRK